MKASENIVKMTRCRGTLEWRTVVKWVGKFIYSFILEVKEIQYGFTGLISRLPIASMCF
jgi:hypothetical protein